MIKPYLVKLAEKITGRKCSRCGHNWRGRCAHGVPGTFERCWQSITRPGFYPRQERKHGIVNLTYEERRQRQKIQDILQEAEDHDRESGLLED